MSTCPLTPAAGTVSGPALSGPALSGPTFSGPTFSGTANLDPPPQAPPGLDELAGHLIGWLKWGVLATGAAGLLTCAGMIVVGRRHRSGLAQDGLLSSLWVIGGLSLAAVATVLVGTVASSVTGAGTP